ncbi:hypothetical protein BDZ97DRAFT_1810888 [Flammula alnicola]|nr:hypothetical protein BDZ97DRAFT_1810888 [Flammula alnicola]
MASASNARPPLPELDLIAIAKTTRKTLDRLASFSHMRSSSDPNPVLTKILNKIISLVQLIDSSMLVAQLGYQLTTDAMILCDTEDADWEANVTVDGLRDHSAKAQEISQRVMEGFRDIKQEVYKIAALTKDNMFVALVPPDPTHAETMKIHLKDVGTDLVANLNLLSEFSRAVGSVAEWWQCVKEDLASENPSLLPSSQPQANGAVDKYKRWAELKEGFQEYYNVVNAAHIRFPDLLTSSSTAWKSVAFARSAAPSSAGHSEVAPHDSGVGPTEGLIHAVAPPAKGMKALVGMLGFWRNSSTRKEVEIEIEKPQEKPQQSNKPSKPSKKDAKGKQKDAGGHGEDNLSRHASRRSSGSSPSRYSTSRRSHQLVSQSEKAENRWKAPCSCCSGNLFEDGVAYLGNHGCMIR